MQYLYGFLVFIAFVIIIAIPYGIIMEKRRQRKLEEVFDERQILDEREFYEKYFQEKNIPFFIIQKVRQILEEELDADLSQLSAKDDFSENLSFFWDTDSLAEVEIIEHIEEEFDIEFQQKDFENLNPFTVERLIEITWEKTQKKDN